jgi:hypothetical protein
MLLEVAQSLGLFTLAIPIALEGVWIPMAWAVEATILVWLGCRLNDWRIRGTGALVHAASLAALMYFWAEAWHTKGMLILNARTATFAVVALALGLSAWLSRQLQRRGAIESRLLTLSIGAAHVTMMILIGIEVHRWYVDARAVLDGTIDVPREAYSLLKWKSQAITVAGMAGYGLAVAALAAVLRWVFNHAMALAAFGVSIVIMLLSLDNLPPAHRLAVWNPVGATFASLACCLALSAAIARYATSPPGQGRPLAISYELLALGGVLLLYFTELLRAANGETLPLFETQRATYYSLFAAATAVYAGGLILRGLWLPSLAHRLAGLACLAATVLFLLVASGEGRTTYRTVLWHPRGVAYLLLVLSATLAAAGYRRRLSTDSQERRVLSTLLTIAVHAAVLACFTLEAEDFWLARSDNWFSDQPAHAWYARHATLSTGYALYAFVLLAAGILRRAALLRWLALVILGGTIIKVFVYDLSRIEAIWRIISFLGLGFLLLAGSLLYHRYRHVLSPALGNQTAAKEATDEMV